MSFPRSFSLKTKAEFKRVFDHSKKINQKHLLALFIKNKMVHARLGIIVSKRVSKSAVVRNRIKRIVRESFRLNQNYLTGLDIIVIARQQCDTLDKFNLRQGIDHLWNRLKTQSPTPLST